MKKLLIASALSAVFASPAVFAQAKNFEGFGIQLSTGYQNNQFKFSDFKADGQLLSPLGYSLPTISSGEMPLNIGAGYTFALSDRFTLGALVEYNPLSMKTGSSNTVVPAGAASTSYSGKLENQVSISLVPGYAFNDTTMGYARVGWINATAKVTSDGLSLSTNSNGVIFGLGAKHLFTKNIYGFAEATYASYGGSNATGTDAQGTVFGVNLTPTSYSFLIGVGYKF